MTEKDPPPMIASIYLSRLRDRSMGQADEIQGLLDMMKGMEKVAGVVNDTLMVFLKQKPTQSQQSKKILVDEAFILLLSGLEKFVVGKTKRISQLINYLDILHQDVSDEKTQLEIFEKEWEPIYRELDIIRVDLMNNPVPTNSDDAMKKIDFVKNNLLSKALPIADKLITLENKMQKRHIQALALLTTMNTAVNTNELYRLLTEEP